MMIMYKQLACRWIFLSVLLLCICLVVGCNSELTNPVVHSETAPPTTTLTVENPDERSTTEPLATATMDQPSASSAPGWAVLAAKEDYSDTGGSDLTTGFLNMHQLKALLAYYGWEDDHILEIRDTLGVAEVRSALDWLEQVAGEDDLVLFFVQAHSSYLRDGLEWHSFFPDEWAEIASDRRVLIVEACQAGEFTATTAGDTNGQLTIASSAADELGWVGLWDEGKPIIGGVFSHYFLSAFTDPTADADGNGQISIQEAAIAAQEPQRRYMHEVIFTVPEFLEGYHANGFYPEADPDFPHVVISDQLGEPVYLDLQDFSVK